MGLLGDSRRMRTLSAERIELIDALVAEAKISAIQPWIFCAMSRYNLANYFH
jgi:hypothetical protein